MAVGSGIKVRVQALQGALANEYCNRNTKQLVFTGPSTLWSGAEKVVAHDPTITFALL